MKRLKEPKSSPRPPEVQALLNESERLHDEAWDLNHQASLKEYEAMNLIFKMAEPLLGLSANKMSYSLSWGCPGQLGVCVFEEEDTCQDYCLFCHQPEERK
jgi:hypothetical protein